MPRGGAIIVRDIVGKLDVECDKCGRRGRYHPPLADRTVRHRRQVIRLVRRDHGRLPAEASDDQCGARCPDLWKVV
jgi:hypothetical protein